MHHRVPAIHCWGGGTPIDPNDGDPCTLDTCDPITGVSNVFQDADGDGTCDANDVCPAGPEPGTACNDNNPITTGDVIGANCVCAGVLPCTPGATCNDNNACTTGEVFDANCNCGGGTAVDPNDNNPCTLDSCDPVTGVSNVFQDADGDGTCDANDVCPAGPEPGTACNDNNPITTGDVIGANCVCAGVLPCTPGATCNDNNACTTGEVFDANCNCGGGTAVDPNDNNPCTLDSCDPVTGVSNVFQDADGDGTCDANDVCPAGPEPGTACNDNNPATTGDVIGANCVCAGVLGCTPGAACNDFNACTTGEVFDANCNCGGGTAVDPNDNNPCTLDSCDPVTGVSNIFQDADGDGTCDANDVCPAGPEPGTACNDNNPITTGDVIGANCVCAGVLPCTPGATCNDNNACTTGEVFDANCNCGGGTAVDPNDNNPCTLDSCDPVTGVSNVFQDADGDGTCDANDVCPAGPEPGTACNDNNPATTGDVIGANCVCAGVLGCTPGAACNDFNACTTGEVFDANCNCGGGTAVDPNDNNPCTLDSCDPVTGVSNVFQDADGDGTCDANDVCPAGPEPGTACDDNNPATNSDVIGANCVCAGVLGCTPGAACNDNNACTTGEVFDANCNCGGGTAVDPNDNNPCTLDSCDPVTGVSNIFQDADGDGTCDANDVCPAGPEPGTACDDNNPATNSDVIGANCVCAGVLGCTPGAACNDNNACTTGEVFDANCNCGGGTAVDPNDNNPCTLDSCDPVTGVSNIFQDADGDGTCDANDVCPAGPEPGTACNDNNPNTIGDVIGTNCVCAGTPIGNCTELLTLDITLDNFGSETTWEVYDETGNVLIVAGGPYTDGVGGTTVSETICLNQLCYRLVVNDDGNNGISGGGYVLRDPLGRRIIDADGQFSSTSSNILPFCLPLSANKLINSQCDKTTLVYAYTTQIYASNNPAASGYQFWMADPHGTYSRRVFKNTQNLQPTNLVNFPPPADLDLNVRVRALVNGVYTAFGPACIIRLNTPGGGSGRSTILFDEASAISLSIYPNPNRGEQLFLVLGGVQANTKVELDVMDLFGKRVFADQFAAPSEEFTHSMDVNGLASGVYLVNVRVADRLYTDRLVKQ
ncbi:MAG: T9SS type A sorting domain-containing protein [Flavobacteriales bacterium]|nr:T9SS type A sorting domain-containing protein [Flavobacteriales bacterium]